MAVKMLDAKKHTNADTGFLCRYVRSDTEYFRPHCHNYYELFLVLNGDAHHLINSKEQILRPGELLFIRDFDVHTYKSVNKEYFDFINLAFTKQMLNSMLCYLGDGFPFENLLSASAPPSVYLGETQKENLFYSLTELNQITNKAVAKTKAKALLINVFTKYFFDYQEKETEIPLWLEVVYEKMNSPQNFIAGSEKMYSLCKMSREHLCRSLKRYYNTTPSALICNLRLEYCANLLITSNLSITEICYECGFENLSWFYKLFTKKYGMTPKQYRKKYTTR